MFLANEFLAGVPHWYSLLDSSPMLLEVMTLTGPFSNGLKLASKLPPLIYLLLSMLSFTIDRLGWLFLEC